MATPAAAMREGLTDEEYAQVVARLGREPNAVELGLFGVLWSEHCCYKSSKRLLKALPTEGPGVLQGPGENAGAVEIGDGIVAVFKMESHNHPSFVEPFQGAATGVGGILRDIFTMGARPVALLDALRFGSLEHPRNRYLFENVVAGIAWYGNCIGVPTVGGDLAFHEIYNHNPLVNAFCIGLAATGQLVRGRAEGRGNPVIYLGARTGRDGIHGASLLASQAFEGTSRAMRSSASRSTVQVGDPFTGKRLLEACLELAERRLIVGIQDMGAAGLTSSSAEMAHRAGTGIELDLDRVPLREEGMTAYEMMLSESQERMLLVAQKGREAEVEAICRKWDVETAVIGRVVKDGRLTVRSRGDVAAQVPVAALVAEAPAYDRTLEMPAYIDALHALAVELLPVPQDLTAALVDLLGGPALASRAPVYEQYDHMVQTNTIVRPGADAAVIRIRGTRKALALTVDGNSTYCVLNPHMGAALAVAEAARNVTCVGARPLALTDSLNFGSPERADVMWQFALTIEGIGDVCRHLGVPVVSGNVSLYNETNSLSIYPTPLIGMVGVVEDVAHVTTPWVKAPGEIVVLLGRTGEDIGGSEYLRRLHHMERGYPPVLHLEAEAAVQRCVREAIQAGFITASHDCAEGGLAVTLAECCLTRPGTMALLGSGPWALLGMEVTLEDGGLRPDVCLFSETPSRVVVTVKSEHLTALERLAARCDVPIAVIGRVGGNRLAITLSGHRVIDAPLSVLHRAWRRGLTAARVHEPGGHDGG